MGGVRGGFEVEPAGVRVVEEEKGGGGTYVGGLVDSRRERRGLGSSRSLKGCRVWEEVKGMEGAVGVVMAAGEVGEGLEMLGDEMGDVEF